MGRRKDHIRYDALTLKNRRLTPALAFLAGPSFPGSGIGRNRSPRNAAGGDAKMAPFRALKPRFLNRAQARAESGPKLPVAMQIPVLNGRTREQGANTPCSHVRAFAGKTDF